MRKWNEEYAADEYLFGRRPNTFLVSCVTGLEPGKALCLGEGEGRNAVYLAKMGYEVTAVDLAPNGLTKTERLAREHNVQVSTVLADVTSYKISPADWDLIICFFVHLDKGIRAVVHRRVVEGLRPGGMYVLEGFSPAHALRYKKGPTDPSKLLDLALIREELTGLELRVGVETERLLDELDPESGMSVVTQVMAVKPGWISQRYLSIDTS